MSRSYRRPGYYVACGQESRKGKQEASRRLRRVSVQECSQSILNIERDHKPQLQDRNRGSKGSRCGDWGWDYFGDGYENHDCFKSLYKTNYRNNKFTKAPHEGVTLRSNIK